VAEQVQLEERQALQLVVTAALVGLAHFLEHPHFTVAVALVALVKLVLLEELVVLAAAVMAREQIAFPVVTVRLAQVVAVVGFVGMV
jgi:hypothetical protein